MKEKILVAAAILLSAIPALAQQTRAVKSIQLTPGTTTSVKGDLNEGSPLGDLSFAWNSAIACFPATQQMKFSGNHVLYTVDMPPHSIVTITVDPVRSGTDLSLYGYQLGSGKHALPKDLSSAVTCEADHKWDYPKRGQVQTDARTIKFNATTNPYTLMIGVTGPRGLSTAAYTLSVALRQ